MSNIFGERLSGSRRIESISESYNLITGNAGTTGYIILNYAPILNSLGDDIGKFGDTSIVVSGSVFSHIVESEDLVLEPGDYYVNHWTGKIKYCKGSSDVSVDLSYKVAIQVVYVYNSSNPA